MKTYFQLCELQRTNLKSLHYM